MGPEPQPLKRGRLGAAAIVGVAAVAALVAALALGLDRRSAADAAGDAVLRAISGALRREARSGAPRLELFPLTRVRLPRLEVLARAGEPPLVSADEVEVAIRLWPLLRSRGKTVEVTDVVVVRPVVTLTHAPDRGWSWERTGPSTAPGGGADADGALPALGRIAIEGGALRIVERSRGRDDEAILVHAVDAEAVGVAPGLPVDVTVAAAIGSEPQDVHVRLSLAKWPAALPARPQDWPVAQGTVHVGALALERIAAILPAGLGAIVRRGTVAVDARVSTLPDGTYRLDGAGSLRDLMLREQPASGRFRADARLAPAHPAAARLELAELALHGPGVDLAGNASLDGAPLRGWFVLTGSLLDLDAVMGPAPPAPARAPLLPAALAEEVRSAAASGTFAIAELRAGPLRATDVRGRASLSGGALTVNALQAAILGGRVRADGARVLLTDPDPPWTLSARGAGLDLATATTIFSGGPPPLSGRLDLVLETAGRGTAWTRLRGTLAGRAALHVADGALVHADIAAEVLRAVSQALGIAGEARDAARPAAGFREGSGELAIGDGAMTTRSLRLETAAGQIAVRGRIGLDGALALVGIAAVPRRAVPGASRARLPPVLQVPVVVGGSIAAPSVRADPAAAGAALTAGPRRVRTP